MKLRSLSFKTQLALSLFLVLALGATGLALAGPVDGSGGGGGCYLTADSKCRVYGNSASCGGGPRWVYSRLECCPSGFCSWKQVASGCGSSCFG